MIPTPNAPGARVLFCLISSMTTSKTPTKQPEPAHGCNFGGVRLF